MQTHKKVITIDSNNSKLFLKPARRNRQSGTGVKKDYDVVNTKFRLSLCMMSRLGIKK